MKHKFFAALAVILGFSAVMSLISAKNYAASLNKVVLTDTHTGVLRKKGVTILERNDQYAAVMEKLENVVEYAARTPVDLEAVRILK